MLDRLLAVWAMESGAAVNAYRSWTLKREGAWRGAEADNCYTVGDGDAEKGADLAVEVVWSHDDATKLAVYAGLGVREVGLEGPHRRPRAGRRLRAWRRGARRCRRSTSPCSRPLRRAPRPDAGALARYRDALARPRAERPVFRPGRVAGSVTDRWPPSRPALLPTATSPSSATPTTGKTELLRALTPPRRAP